MSRWNIVVASLHPSFAPPHLEVKKDPNAKVSNLSHGGVPNSVGLGILNTLSGLELAEVVFGAWFEDPIGEGSAVKVLPGELDVRTCVDETVLQLDSHYVDKLVGLLRELREALSLFPGLSPSRLELGSDNGINPIKLESFKLAVKLGEGLFSLDQGHGFVWCIAELQDVLLDAVKLVTKVPQEREGVGRRLTAGNMATEPQARERWEIILAIGQ